MVPNVVTQSLGHCEPYVIYGTQGTYGNTEQAVVSSTLFLSRGTLQALWSMSGKTPILQNLATEPSWLLIEPICPKAECNLLDHIYCLTVRRYFLTATSLIGHKVGGEGIVHLYTISVRHIEVVP